MGCYLLHQLTELLTHDTEVTLHLLNKDALTLNESKVLNVHLVLDKVCNSLNVLLLSCIDSRNHNLC